jgi:predicted PurR-regulated permease PerM
VQKAGVEIDRLVNAQAPPPAPGVQRVQRVPPAFDINEYLADAGISAAVTGTETAVVGLLSFLMICAGDLYKRKLVSIGGAAFARRRLTVEVIRSIDRQIQRYLLVRLLISAIVAAATAAGLWLIGMSHAIAWGVIAGVLNVLPFIGPAMAIALIAIAAFLQFKAVEPTLLAAGIETLVAALEGNLLTPSLTSRAGDLNTVAVFVSVLFWGWLWGIAGLVLAIPIMVAIKAAADHIEPLQPVGELLGL